MDVGCDDRIELNESETGFLRLGDRIPDKHLSDVSAARAPFDSIAAVRYVPAPSDIVRMEDVETEDLSVLDRETGIGLRRKETVRRLRIETIGLRERYAVLDDLVPHRRGPFGIFRRIRD